MISISNLLIQGI